MFEQVFLKSMVKGIGKATGTMIVLGVVGGGIWYASRPKRLAKTKKRVKETKETQTVQMESVDQLKEQLEEQLEEKVEEQMEHVDISNVIPRRFLESENKYKEIFDKLRS